MSPFDLIALSGHRCPYVYGEENIQSYTTLVLHLYTQKALQNLTSERLYCVRSEVLVLLNFWIEKRLCKMFISSFSSHVCMAVELVNCSRVYGDQNNMVCKKLL